MLNGVEIEDSFAEAFPMQATRLVVTADSLAWAYHAAGSMTGFATSVIACGCEAGIERELAPQETPDGRPGLAVLVFAMTAKDLATQVQARVGQCVLTAPSSACYSGIAGEATIGLGRALRYFGDGFQISKRFGGRRYWRIPAMDGEFVCEDRAGVVPAIGGGNFLIFADGRAQALGAAERAITAMRALPGVIMPFPGGVVRSGSKIGSRYKKLVASTNDAYCPTLKGQTTSRLGPDIEAVLEIVIDGLGEDEVARATAAGVRAACSLGREGGIRGIGAGNYGGKLGPHLFHLRQLLA